MTTSQTLSDLISDAILSYIEDAHLEVGDALPSEFELAQQLKVGRSTIREAIKYLESLNVVEVRQGAGTFIRHKTIQTTDPLGLGLMANHYKLALDLLDVRFLLEPTVIALAVEHATTQELASVTQLINQLPAKLEADTELFLDSYKDMLVSFIQLCGNEAYNNLLFIFQESIQLNHRYLTLEDYQELLRAHSQLALAVERQEAIEAANSVKLALTTIRRVLRKQAPTPS
ncbi:FadR family transcriptional regulator [Vagococcus sp. BWB3-3]|uniref:FadR family transcriptional regulator n=1 Tax=Vagococcus allomyrinae TaxID=2794353 RepID=A0A940PDL4_9ENTE|nr:GntR family transcriptional regulator [Vagococcus allomyrinae]MBP1042984.1 FadR family transcriptional regulator [Vagococcus allomyrinae]